MDPALEQSGDQLQCLCLFNCRGPARQCLHDRFHERRIYRRRIHNTQYDSAGDFQWSARYNGSTSTIDYANCIVVDGSGNSYVTGWSGGANNLHDYTTIKYSPEGDELWVRRYNGSPNDNDYAYWL